MSSILVNPVIKKDGVYTRVVRDTRYSYDMNTKKMYIGDMEIDAKKDEEKYLFAFSIIDSEKFCVFLENALKLSYNEEKVGREVLETKHAKAYKSLVKEVKSSLADYLLSAFVVNGRYERLHDFFVGEEFKQLFHSLSNQLKECVNKRDFVPIPKMVDTSECMRVTIEKDLRTMVI